MKKILLAASLLAATTVSFAGQYSVSHAIVAKGETEKGKHISVSEVPSAVIASFNSMFPGATNVRWEREREHGQVVYQAKFVLNGVRGKEVFNADGTLN